MVNTDPSFALFQIHFYIITQHNTKYSVNSFNSDVERYFYVSLVSARVIPASVDSPTPGHSNTVNYNLILLKIIFDYYKDKITLCYMDKLIGVLFLQGLY